jgi:hypothetical protein
VVTLDLNEDRHKNMHLLPLNILHSILPITTTYTTCVDEDDVYFYYATVRDQLMDGFVPWRGASAKHPTLIHMFYEVLCKPGGVVIDVTTSRCGFVILSSTFMFQKLKHNVSTL